MFSCLSKKIKNDIYLSVCFAVFFSALNAQSHVQVSILIPKTLLQSESYTFITNGFFGHKFDQKQHKANIPKNTISNFTE